MIHQGNIKFLWGLTIFFLTTSLSLYGQTTEANPAPSLNRITTSLGLKAGYKRSIFKNEFKGDVFEYISGYQIGLFLEQKRGSTFSFLLGADYSVSGSDIDIYGQEINLSYLKFNVLPRINWRSSYAGIGGYYGVLLSSKEINNPMGYLPYFDTEKMNQTDWGMLFNLGIRVLKIFQIELQYELGLASIFDGRITGAAGPRFETFWHRSRAININLGFTYYLWENNARERRKF